MVFKHHCGKVCSIHATFDQVMIHPLVDKHHELGSLLKRCRLYVVNLFNQTPIFGWHMARLVVMNIQKQNKKQKNHVSMGVDYVLKM